MVSQDTVVEHVHVAEGDEATTDTDPVPPAEPIFTDEGVIVRTGMIAETGAFSTPCPYVAAYRLSPDQAAAENQRGRAFPVMSVHASPACEMYSPATVEATTT